MQPMEASVEFKIGYRQGGSVKRYAPKKPDSEASVETVVAAWKLVQDLERSDEIVTYIISPTEGKIGKDELQLLAEREIKASADRP
jgi:hypothetical protein